MIRWLPVFILLLALSALTGCKETVEEPSEEVLAAKAVQAAQQATDGYFAALDQNLAAVGLQSVSFLGVTDNSLDGPDANVERQFGNEILARMAKFSEVKLFKQNSDIIKALLSERGLQAVSDIGQEDIAEIGDKITGDCIVYGSVEDIETNKVVLFAARKEDGQILWGETLETLHFSSFKPGESASETASTATTPGETPSGESDGGGENYDPWSIE